MPVIFWIAVLGAGVKDMLKSIRATVRDVALNAYDDATTWLKPRWVGLALWFVVGLAIGRWLGGI